MWRISAGLYGPSLFSHASSSATECACSNTQLRSEPEVARIARPRNGEAVHGHAVHPFLAGRQFIPPGDVVLRARRQDPDIGVAGQAFGEVTGEQFGAAVDVRSIPLNDNGQLH